MRVMNIRTIASAYVGSDLLRNYFYPLDTLSDDVQLNLGPQYE